ncbi:MAG: protein kinase [Holophagae bacterium]|jgi:serine/threonine protein kinase
MIGKTLAHFEVTAHLGAGGMGEVWRATDTTLDRDVALKLLPAELVADVERLRRFQREAKIVAGLNHPNIATIYGFETEGETSILVMELVEGLTLAERLRRGPLTIDDAIAVARQVAEALEHAHEKGIIHRDLKPANIMIDDQLNVKVLDFGLAKALDPSASRPPTSLESIADSPTVSVETTRAGSIFGTAAYMAPEQARGKPVDTRADIWAFGCVVYEMLTGSQAFAGETVSDTLAAILRETPDWDRIPAGTPARIRLLLERCMAKDPRQRIHHVADARLDLDSSEVERPEAPMTTRTPNPWRWIAIAGALATAALSWSLLRPEPPRSAAQFTRLTYERGTITGAAFAPDEHTVIYSACWGDEPSRVYLRRLDSLTALDVDLGDGRVHDASADGRVALIRSPPLSSFAVSSELGTLAVADITGGGVREIIGNALACSFGPDGVLAVSRMLENSGTIEYPPGRVLAEVAGQSYDVAVSPDGSRVAYVDGPVRRDTGGRIAVVGTDGGVRHLTDEWGDINGLAWTPDGRGVVFSGAENGRWLIRLVTLDGLVEQRIGVPTELRIWDMASDGRLLVATGESRVETWVDDAAGSRELTLRAGTFPFDLSRNGRQIVTVVMGGREELEVFSGPSDGSPLAHIGEGYPFAISPDRRWVVGRETGSTTRLTLWPTGPGESRHVPLEFEASLVRWHPDGASLVAVGSVNGEAQQLWRIDLDTETAEPVSAYPVTVDLAARFYLSPDGTTAAIRGGNGRVELLPLDGGEPWPVPGMLDGDALAGWGLDGWLFIAERSAESRGHVRLIRLDPDSGTRETFREIQAHDPSGVEVVGAVQVASDGSTVAYAIFRDLASVYVVENW